MADYGLKVSKAGQDVLTADVPNLAFTTKYNTYKVKAQGSGTITVSGGNGSVDINHGLSATPGFLVFMEDAIATDRRYPIAENSVLRNWRARCNATRLRIENLASPLTNGDYDYYYYIFYDAQ